MNVACPKELTIIMQCLFAEKQTIHLIGVVIQTMFQLSFARKKTERWSNIP